ncbi:MAG: indole-3-glycerol-phosphate synthase [Deltaproteobacteria bacterium]|nr:indole-3-glycerol-phosphate synthase [Deltaproteobacteria bacterium]
MSDILDRILLRKRWELDILRDALRGNLRERPGADWFCGPEVLSRAKEMLRAGGVERTTRGFTHALRNEERLTVIAEIKRRSPSAGRIAAWEEPDDLATAYAEGGADAVSCLTDWEFFGGRPRFLPQVRTLFGGPVLRKDFVTDVVDLAVAAALDADAVLLIVAALGPETSRLQREARSFGLETLVEVHDVRELDLAMAAGAAVVGVNNRDLRTFTVDLGTTERLAEQLPSPVLLVGESGIKTPQDAARMRRAGCDAVLVGESLARRGGDGLAALQVAGERRR